MIKEAYVGFEVAKLLKEKGFNIRTQFVWYENSPFKAGEHSIDFFYRTDDDNDDRFVRYSNNDEIPSYISGEVFSCPTHQLAMAWIREKGWHIDISLSYDDNDDACYYVLIENTETFLSADTELDDKEFKTYEEAVEASLKYSLENLI